ncbi:MAG: toll/interleukin-1 receptor domain-containing protein [Patescibacteria group bacterium]
MINSYPILENCSGAQRVTNFINEVIREDKIIKDLFYCIDDLCETSELLNINIKKYSVARYGKIVKHVSSIEEHFLLCIIMVRKIFLKNPNLYSFISRQNSGEIKFSSSEKLKSSFSDFLWILDLVLRKSELIEFDQYGYPLYSLRIKHKEVISYAIKVYLMNFEKPKILNLIQKDGENNKIKSPIKKDFFLSYASQNENFVLNIKNYLQELGFSCWHDLKEIKSGNNIVKAIKKGLLKSNSGIIFISKEYISKYDNTVFLKIEAEKLLKNEKVHIILLDISRNEIIKYPQGKYLSGHNLIEEHDGSPPSELYSAYKILESTII